MLVYLAFYKANQGIWSDKLISLIDGSAYSHVEFAVPLSDNPNIYTCYSSSARNNGVRCKQMRLSDKWDVIPIHLTVEEYLNALNIFHLNQGKSYDYFGLITTKMNWFPNSKNKWFCSELTAKMLGLPRYKTYGINKLYKEYNK